MILQSVLEFRGSTQTKSSKGDKIYNYINVEDLTGESCKLYCDYPVSNLRKGLKYDAVLDYSPRYGSIKVIDLKERK